MPDPTQASRSEASQKARASGWPSALQLAALEAHLDPREPSRRQRRPGRD